MALDYGGKRTGVAVTDELQIIASGLTTVQTAELFPFLEKYFASNEVEKLIVGEPKRLNNEATHSTEAIQKFIQQFKDKFPQIPVVTIDERFTSKLAQQSILASGVKKKNRQNKELTDEVSATIILQDFMTQRDNGLV